MTRSFPAILLILSVVTTFLAAWALGDAHKQGIREARNLPILTLHWPQAPRAEAALMRSLRDVGVTQVEITTSDNMATFTSPDPLVLSPQALDYLNSVTPWASWSSDTDADAITAQITRQHFLLGTDGLGRDRFAQLIRATATSILFAVLAAGLAITIGAAYGLLSGYVGGTLDQLMMRSLEVFFAIPAFFLAVLATLYLGNGFIVLAAIVAFVEWPDIARYIRARVRLIRSEDYIRAAHAMGASHARILTRHVIPSILRPMRKMFVISLTRVVALESTISFLGLSFLPPEYSLGSLIAEAMSKLQTQPVFLLSALSVFVGLIWLLLSVTEWRARYA